MKYQDNDNNQLNNRSEEAEPLKNDDEVKNPFCERRLRFIDQLVNSITKPKTLIDMTEARQTSFVKYYIVLILITVILVFVIPTAATVAGFGGFQNLFRNKIPSFRVTDGKLIAEKQFQITTTGATFYIDPAVDNVEDMKLSDNMTYVAFTRSSYAIFYRDNGKNVTFMAGKISNIFSEGTDNETLVGIVPYIYGFFFAYFIVTFIQMTMRYLILALFYMIFASNFNRQSGLRLSSGALIKICIYAQTIGILAVNLNIGLGQMLPATLVSIAGVVTSILIVKASFKEYLPQGSNFD